MKTLTVSIAAFNVENYIEKCLESLCDERIIDQIEVFVIDDGGTDRTMSIADTFVQKYPDSIHSIRKKNGGYGSTYNLSIKKAKGIYFKMLDGDDWFDKESFVKLVNYLSGSNSDIVVSDYYLCDEIEYTKIVDCSSKYLERREIRSIQQIVPINNWALTYRTSVLRNSGIILPEKSLYTDQYLSIRSFAFAKTISGIQCPVYCYRMNREGQSTSIESIIDHVQENNCVCVNNCMFYERIKLEKNPNIYFVREQVKMYYIFGVKMLLSLPITKSNYKLLLKFENSIKSTSKEIFHEITSYGKIGIFIRFCRLSRYYPYFFLIFVSRKLK